MLIPQGKIFLLWVALCVASATQAAPDIEALKRSLVTVMVKSGGVQHQSVGIVLGNERVLALRAEQKNDPQFSVKAWSGDAVLVARPDEKDASMGDSLPLMILHVPGLQLSAAGFLSDEPVTGSAYTPVVQRNAQENRQGDIDAITYEITYEIKRGALADIWEFQPLTGIFFKKPQGPLLHLVSHNVLVTAEKFGSPVVNECGQVMAVSIADPRLDKAQRARNPQDAMVALVAAQIIQWLQAAEIEIHVADEVCISAEQHAQAAESKAQLAAAQAQAAENKAQAAEAKVLAAKDSVTTAEAALTEALSKASTSEEQKVLAQQALQQAQDALDDAAQAAQDALDDAAQAAQDALDDAAQAAQEALDDKNKLYGAIASGGLLFILLLWLLSNRKKKTQIKAEREKVAEAERKAQNAIAHAQAHAQAQAQAQAEARRAPFDCVLEGQDADGKRYLLKLSKAALGDADGVILGRNPRNSTFIIGHEEISREHAHLYIDDNRLYVCDLDSANGTCVNGARLHAKDSVQLVDGATLDIGPIQFSVRLI